MAVAGQISCAHSVNDNTVDAGCTPRPAVFISQTHPPQMRIHLHPVQMFGQDIAGILLSWYLVDAEVAFPHPFLYPQLSHREMPHTPNACTLHNADGGRRVGKIPMSTSMPKSLLTLHTPSPSAAPFTIPASSASAEESVTVFWVTAQCLTRC